MTRPDVIVIGLGSMGAAAAWQLAARGLRVVGFDRFTPPHERGAHAGGSRIIRMTYAEGAAYVPLLRRAYAAWGEIEQAGGVSLITPTTGLNLGLPASATVSGALSSAREHGLAHEVLDAAEVRRRFAAFTPSDGEIAVLDEAAGIVAPERAVETLLALAAREGVQLRFGTAVDGFTATATGVRVTTPGGDLEADRLVLCPGGWAPGLLGSRGAQLRVQRRMQHYWDPVGDEYAVGNCPVWIWDGPDGITAYGMPRMDGLVKAAFHDADDPADAEVGAAAVRPGEELAVRRWLAGRLPVLANAAYRGGKQCLYTLTPDENFLVGTHPEHPNVAIGAGFSGHGFKFVPVIGEILADLVIEGRTAYPIDLFDPRRYARS